jgi:hypothetical protein
VFRAIGRKRDLVRVDVEALTSPDERHADGHRAESDGRIGEPSAAPGSFSGCQSA